MSLRVTCGSAAARLRLLLYQIPSVMPQNILLILDAKHTVAQSAKFWGVSDLQLPCGTPC